MDWSNLFTEVGSTFFKCLIIIGSYKIAKEYVPYARRKAKTKAGILEKAGIVITVLITGFIASLALTAAFDNSRHLITNVFILNIPALIGVGFGFNKDSKIPNEEKFEQLRKERIDNFKKNRTRF